MGVFLMLAGAPFTLGTAFVAPVAVLAAWWFLRRRGQRLSLFGSWTTAITATAVALAIGAGIVYMRMDPDLLDESVAEARAAEQQPLPPWLERLGSQSKASPGTEKFINSRPVTVYFGLLGGVLVFLILGTIAGTMGWAGALLLAFCCDGVLAVVAGSQWRTAGQ